MVDIRVARPNDAPGIAEVHVRAWQTAYRGQVPDELLDALSVGVRSEAWRGMITESVWPTKVTLVAEDDERIVGFAHVSPSRDDDAGPTVGEVTAIYLLPEFWNRGIGRALFERAMETLRLAGFVAATLWVLDTNTRARRFYDAAGWTPDGASKVDERGTFSLHEVRYRRGFANG